MKQKSSWFYAWQWAGMLTAFLLPYGILALESSVYADFSGNVGMEYRHFMHNGLYDQQKRDFYAFSAQPEFLLEWKDGRFALNFTGFGRIDLVDDSRNHLDVRELYFQTVADRSEFSVGFKKVYWGVTEAAHLVDIINQTDNLETFDGEQKLGQLMTHYSYNSNFGIFDLFAMTLFRKRVFPGVNGRFRTPVPITDEQIGFESDMEEWRPDLAIRWSHYFGPIDVGLSHFYGTGREPVVTGLDSNGHLVGAYAIVNQTGLDIQATTGPVLWKFESIIRLSSMQDMFALDAGFEYTFGNIGGSGMDIGLLGEYMYDDRGDIALSSLQSDVFAGGRLAFNDTQSTAILFGGLYDVHRQTKMYSVEGSRRFGTSLTASLEVRLFQDVSDEEFVYLFRDDGFVKADIAWFF